MDTRELIWNIYTEVRVEENHFNALQADYRKLAATWSLALFAAVAFFLFPKAPPAPSPPRPPVVAPTPAIALPSPGPTAVAPVPAPTPPLRAPTRVAPAPSVAPSVPAPPQVSLADRKRWLAIVGAIHALGVLALFALDMGAYHRLLLSAFFTGQELEKEFEWLPNMRIGMENVTDGWVMKGTAAFYSLTASLGAAIALAAMFDLLTGPDQSPLWLAGIYSILSLVLCFGVMRISGDEGIHKDTFNRATSAKPFAVGCQKMLDNEESLNADAGVASAIRELANAVQGADGSRDASNNIADAIRELTRVVEAQAATTDT